MENLPKALSGVYLLRWIVTYPVDKVIRSLNSWGQVTNLNTLRPNSDQHQIYKQFTLSSSGATSSVGSSVFFFFAAASPWNQKIKWIKIQIVVTLDACRMCEPLRIIKL